MARTIQEAGFFPDDTRFPSGLAGEEKTPFWCFGYTGSAVRI